MAIVGYSLAGLLALVLLLLCVPVRLAVRVRTGEPAAAWVRWLFFKFSLLPQPEKAKAEAPAKKKAKKEKKPKKEKKKVRAKPTEVSDQIGLVVDLLAAAKGGLKFLIRHFRFYKLRVFLVVAEGDAAETAIAYGKANAAVWAAYAAAREFLSLAKPEISIQPDFAAREGRVDLEVRARLAPIVAVGAALRIGCSFLVKIIRRKRSAGDAEKAAPAGKG